MAGNDKMAISRQESLFVTGLESAQIDEPLPRATWVLYLLLRSEDFALLVGSAVLFAALAFVMILTRRCCWPPS